MADGTRVDVSGDLRPRLTFEDGIVCDITIDEREWRGVVDPLVDPPRPVVDVRP